MELFRQPILYKTRVSDNFINKTMQTSQNYIQHALNASPTKQTYTFSKNNRFFSTNKVVNDKFYTLPSTFSRRSCSFGFGNKTQIINRLDLPSPGHYENQGSFENKCRYSTISVGFGRQKVKFGNFLAPGEALKKYPGPGAYKMKGIYSKRGGKMAAKLPTEIDLKVKNENPGPGTYDLQAVQIHRTGSYIVSQYKNNLSPTYHRPTLKSRIKTQIHLGPGEYEITKQKFGKSILSKFKNSSTNSFSREQRHSLADGTKKGFPGFKYKRFSEFGQDN